MLEECAEFLAEYELVNDSSAGPRRFRRAVWAIEARAASRPPAGGQLGGQQQEEEEENDDGDGDSGVGGVGDGAHRQLRQHAFVPVRIRVKYTDDYDDDDYDDYNDDDDNDSEDDFVYASLKGGRRPPDDSSKYGCACVSTRSSSLSYTRPSESEIRLSEDDDDEEEEGEEGDHTVSLPSPSGGATPPPPYVPKVDSFLETRQPTGNS